MFGRVLAAAMLLSAPAIAQSEIGDILDRLAGADPRPAPFAPRMSDDDGQSIGAAIVPCLDDAAMNRRVEIAAVMNEDGTVQSARIIYGAGMTAGKAALQAFTDPDCQPLPMPARGFVDGAEYRFILGSN